VWCVVFVWCVWVCDVCAACMCVVALLNRCLVRISCSTLPMQLTFFVFEFRIWKQTFVLLENKPKRFRSSPLPKNFYYKTGLSLGGECLQISPYLRPRITRVYYRYSSTLSITSALVDVEWSAARPARTLPPGKTLYPLCRTQGVP